MQLSISSFPANSFGADDGISLRYDDGEFSDESNPSAVESSLQMFHWNESIPGWELINSSLDTSSNSVSSNIPGDGLYAVFTTDTTTDVGDYSDNSLLPESFSLEQNYPNPFNSSTSISFSLPVSSKVKLEIFNILGQVVRALHNGRLGAGVHKYTWNGSSSASGVDPYRLTAGDYTESRKIMLLK